MVTRNTRWSALGIAVLCWSASLWGAPQKPVAAWAEFTGDGVSVRALVSNAVCPKASVDGEPLVLQVRQAATAAFPLTTCQATAPAGARKAVVAGQKLKLTPRKLNRIVVIGDTGCRLKGTQTQPCNDPKLWPFATVTRNAAAKKPDMVIHVGDYLYRETPCPAGDAGCAGSPHGDGWASWSADFFAPAASLLGAAPWLLARGNHEQCTRSAVGWFSMLDAGKVPLTCPATAAPFQVKLRGLTLDVIDTADMVDLQLGPEKVAFYERQLPPAPARMSSGTTWVVTHRPIWGYELTTIGETTIANNPLVAKVLSRLDRPPSAQLPGVDMVVSGHVHMFGTLDFGPLRPAQLIVGDSGTALELADTRSGQQKIDGLMTQFTVKDTFGYFLLTRKRSVWTGTLYAADDAVLATCSFHDRAATCTPQPH